MTASSPQPQGNYRPVMMHDGIAYVAGMTPRVGGRMVATGIIGRDVSLEDAGGLVRLATSNAADAVADELTRHPDSLRVRACLRLVVFLACDAQLTVHYVLGDHASAVIAERFGDGAVGVRTVVGVGSLPGGAPCEVQSTFALETLRV